MYNRKKKARRLIVFGLCLMMLMSTGIVANAAKYRNTFDFKLNAGGGSGQTPKVEKTYNVSYASIEFTTCENTSSYPLWWRVRGNDDSYATDAYPLNGTGEFFPKYINDNGEYKKHNYLKVQTDSLSNVGATVKGSWMP